MDIKVSERLNGIGEYYFSQKLREIEELNKQGKKIINLGIGSPDLPPHPDVIKVLQEESAKSNVHAYQSYKGSPVLRNAIAAFYKTWYGVDVNADTDVLPLIGSKEGIMHICMTYLNNGDKALIPNPGYPTYSSAVKLAGGTCKEYALTGENNWEPDFEALGNTDLSKVKLMWINYPEMPTGKQASVELFEKVVAFGRKHNILICHDNPYSFILNEQPISILSVAGAKEVALELNSLSKASNMAGWRVGMMVGAKERIEEVLRFKSNMDSGMFLPVQLAAAKALSLDKEWYDQLNAVYSERRELVYRLLDLLQCEYDKSQVGMFVWAKIPSSQKDGFALSDEVLYNKNVFITPGGIFGSNGNGYIRISLCAKKEVLEEALERIMASPNSSQKGA
ncbi:aminotransferase class I/II-fold pyridoxal phosphate-dependent enzyme [Segetibacter sp.]|jgi:LL-diaminopimelate aminotransferase|uniref:pyridoxal phosphate-dependent aminotransferase n=1 Tax=Segetibacter sp. TaxID=2231182 RepID=UPI00261BA7F5|nr:aminotransferase class I/II-fold pyridoxal phosphate-dependent enzyme [Segetibacter sp.]MCW3080931.1 aminotransferase class I/II-fold pyridoxal phosphate-dependent enzyme [Segetibacter sp.]